MTQYNLNFEDSGGSVAEEPSAPLLPPPSLDGINRLAVDTETTNEKSMYDRRLVGISYRLPDGQKRYLPVRHPRSRNHDVSALQEWARRELRGKELVVANAKHEADTMLRFGADLEAQGCQFRDVFNQAALLDDHRRKTNLDALAREEFNRGKVDLGDTDAYPIHERPAHAIEKYAVEDADLAWLLDEVYTPRIVSEGLEAVLKLEDSLTYAVALMERNGVYLDVETAARWEKEVSEEYDNRIMAVHAATGMRVNPNSGEGLARLFRQLGIPPTGLTTESGDESFTEDALLGVNHPMVALALEARQLSSLLSKYLTKYLKAVEPSGLLRYSLHQLRGDQYGTITGRFSSSDVNIQQVSVNKKQPKLLQRWPIRSLFVPPQGRVWASADASQIEYRLFAHYAASSGLSQRLARAYRDDPNTDFHALVMKWTGLIREFAKNANFCGLYGGGGEKLAVTCKVSKDEGYRLKAQYDQEFPEARQLLSMMSGIAEKRGYVSTFLGRRRRYREGDRFYSALNAVLQGTAGDIMKKKILEQHRERKRLDFTPRLTVHDESDGDLPSDPEALRMWQTLLNEQTTPLEVPILWDAATGNNWHEAH